MLKTKIEKEKAIKKLNTNKKNNENERTMKLEGELKE
jgi:hypothetical protein